jgi:predicted PurR-regulated permease PerM
VTTVLHRVTDAIREFVLGGLGDIVGAAADIVTIAILGGFLTFFLLVDGDRSWDWLLASTDGWRREALMTGGHRAVEQVGGYIRGTALTAAATAVLAGLSMALLGVPFAGPLAVLALIGAFIPYIGRALTALLIFTIALASVGPLPAIALFVLFVLGSIAIDRALAQMATGRRLELHPILAVVGLPMGLALAGFSGLVVILPLLAFAQTTAGVLATALGREPVTAPTAPATSEMVPVWLDRLGQWSWRALVVAALFALVTQVALLFPGVIMPVVIAVILAATLAPAAAALERRGVSRTMAAMAVTVGTGVTIIGVLVVTVASLIGPLADLVSTATTGAERSGAQTVGVGSFVAAIGGGLQATVAGALADFVGIMVVLALGGFLTFYFIRDGGRVWQGLTRVLPSDRRGPLDAAGSRAADVLGGYMLGTAVISLVGAASQWLIMVILGLPFALPLTVLALFAGFIPYVGGFITTGLAFLVALAVGDSTTIVIMFIYTIVFNIVQGNFVTPLVYGKAVSLHPAIILIAVPIGSALAGIVGMFLVVPVAGVIATTWRAVLQTIDAGRIVEPVPPAMAVSGDVIGPTVPGAVDGA